MARVEIFDVLTWAAGANALRPPIPWRSQERVREYAVRGSAVSRFLITVLR
jgi:hypothetical protein